MARKYLFSFLAVALMLSVSESAYVVTFTGPSGTGNRNCSGGGAGQGASVMQLPETDECRALHGAPAERPFYKLTLNDAGTAIGDAAYLCTNSSCSDCLVSSVEFDECVDMGESLGTSVSFRRPSPDGTLLPSSSSASTPYNGITMLWYHRCGDQEALRGYNSIGDLPNRSICKKIEGYPLYQNLYAPMPGLITGGWFCSDSQCASDTCAISYSNQRVEMSRMSPETGCFLPVYSLGLNVSYGPQPTCTCSVDHIYMNVYRADQAIDANCAIGGKFQEVVISRMNPGITAYRDDVDNYNRYLDLDWDEQQHKNIIKKVGFLCAYKNDSCQYYINDAKWLQCYDETKVTGSIAFYPPSDICYGSNNLQLDQGGIMTYTFSGDTCTDDLNLQPNTMLTIRGYPRPTNTCMPDGNTNSKRGWFRMAVNASSAAQLRFDGVLGCKNSDCTNCAVTLNDVPAGACVVTSSGALRLGKNEDLVRCRDPDPEYVDTTVGTTAEPKARERYPHEDPSVIIGACAGVLVLAGVMAGFMYHMRVRTRREYESLGGHDAGGSRSRSRSSHRRGGSRGRSREARSAVYYDGI
eukprot:m.334691 g.334691  ORF g.334691 m.334691 type:complete len:580 (-) comp20511_c0_seq2:1373-3112(-)